jgi:hypothetical protein
MPVKEKARQFIGYLDSGSRRQDCQWLILFLSVSFSISADEVVRRIREIAA